MESLERRAVLFASATAATLPALFAPRLAFAQRYRPDEGREIAPGVRRVELTKRASEIPGYATVSLRDVVYQPGSKSGNPSMANDMVCHCLEGELHVTQGPGKQFVARTGDVWSCKKGMPETNVNNGQTVAIMRVIDLIPPA
jgi:hypothetical protein